MDSNKALDKITFDSYFYERKPSEEEYVALQRVTEAANALKESLSDIQLSLFSDYAISVSEYKLASERQAFFDGARLATELLEKKSKSD